MSYIYDLLIVGGGPAGMSAGIYAGRARLKTVLFERCCWGGQAATTDELINYPAYYCYTEQNKVERMTGAYLAKSFYLHAKAFGCELIQTDLVSLSLLDDVKKVVSADGKVYEAKAIILALGARPKRIGCPGEEELVGKGVSYCATCDGDLFEDLDIFVVGGGNAAVEEALYLTRFGRKVTVIHRRDQLRCAQEIQEKAFSNPKFSFIWDSVVSEFIGKDLLEGIRVENLKTGVQRDIVSSNKTDPLMGCFIFIGSEPQTSLVKEQVELDKSGYIITNETMSTNIPGVFAVGDCREKYLRQVITAASDGAIAAVAAGKYLEEIK